MYNNFLDNLSGDIPPILQSYVEWQTNKSLPSPLASFLGGESNTAPIVPERLKNLPNRYQYTSKTSQLARWFGNMWDISPVKLERLIKTNTGTLGAEGLALIDEIAYATGLAKDERPAQRESNFLLLGNWVKNSPSNYTRYAKEFYNLREKHRLNIQAEKKGESYKSKGKFNVLETYNKRISSAFKEYRDIESRDISAEAKKRLLNEKQKQINALYKEAVERVK